MSNVLQVLIEGQQKRFETVLADPSINFEREAGFAIQALNSNDYLAKIAMGNKDSLVAAINNIAAIGISLNPASKLAYLVPRDGKVCLDISYMGLMHIAQTTGAIQWGQSAIVYENDTFELNGVDKPPTHKFNPFGADRGAIVGAYVVVKTDTGDYLTHAMPVSKIDDIKKRSATVKAGKRSPWDTDYEEMAKKTVIKQAAKMWPRRDRLDAATHNLNTDVGEGINFEEKDVTPYNERQEAISLELRDASLNGLEALQVVLKKYIDAKDLDFKKVWIDEGDSIKKAARAVKEPEHV